MVLSESESIQRKTSTAGEITDVRISYPLDLSAQMLEYSAATRHLRPVE